MSENNALLQMRNISKEFSGVYVLQGVDLTVEKGSIHALMGENGAGKSTLMKILTGFYTRTAGEITFDGETLDTTSIDNVLKQGISMIYQELNTMDNLTVAENIFLGKEPCTIKNVQVDRKTMNKQTQDLLDELEMENIKPTDRVGALTLAQKQLLEIVKAVSNRSKLIIMDEPTSAITEKECQRLFKTIRRLTATGVAIIYITHKMNEVFGLADTVTILRDGQVVGRELSKDITADQLVARMVGRDLSGHYYPEREHNIGEVMLEVKDLSSPGWFSDVNFTARKGEIIGVAGLMGAGRTEIMETIFGCRTKSSGEVYVKGEKVDIKSSKDAIGHNMAFLTEDRKKNGCYMAQPVYFNTMLLTWKYNKAGAFINHKAGREVCKEQIKNFGVKTTGYNQLIRYLSGGNQQKVLLSRWLLAEPEILILDEPTRGIDVGSKYEIYKEMNLLVSEGKTIIMVSSELPEILGMSDRVMTVYEGKVTGILETAKTDQEEILSYAQGLRSVEAG